MMEHPRYDQSRLEHIFLSVDLNTHMLCLQSPSHSHPALAGCAASLIGANRFNGFLSQTAKNR